MPRPEFRIKSDGTMEIRAGAIRLSEILPFINEAAVPTLSVRAEGGAICYETAAGSLTCRIRAEGDELILSTSVQGFDAVHDIEPIGAARIAGADHVYVQGYGMEGPSGFHRINERMRRSHGLIGLSGSGSALVIYTTDHEDYNTEFNAWRQEQLYSERVFLRAGVNLEGTAIGDHRFPELHFLPGDEVVSTMQEAAKRIAAAMRARKSEVPAFHWCSWYYHYENFSQSALETMLKDLADDPVPFRYIQVDAGYAEHVGDWLLGNHRYPDGLKGAADAILQAGYAAGIWIAPFMVGDQSVLYREHPDWVLHCPDGSPYVRFRSYTEPKLWGNTDNDYYVLDVTHPDAREYLAGIFRTLRQDGFTLYKTDFLLWGMQDSSAIVRYDNSKTSVQVYRSMMAMIREIIGEESYLLGSIAPFMASVGYVDGMRIASDMGAQWTDGAFGPSNLLQELPYDNYFNHVYWQNDPDSVIVRNFATHLTEEEVRSVALLQALSGGIITTSDPIGRLTEDRKELLRFITPDTNVSACFPYLTEDREEIVITHCLKDWNLLYVLNPTDHPLRVELRMDSLFGQDALFQYRFEWNDDRVVSEKSDRLSDILAPHGSVLLFLTEEPMRAKPSNLFGRNVRYSMVF